MNSCKIRRSLVVLLLLLGLAHGARVNGACKQCTSNAKVWCPAQRGCVEQESDCVPMDLSVVKWFKSVGSCSLSPVSLPSLCPEVEVEFDPRVGNVMYGNMISVPIQPRLLIYDIYSGIDYNIGGYFSYIPTNSRQRPEFFFFSQSVDKFVHFHYQPYHSVPPDEFSSNSSQILQFLDLTVVGNVGLKYEIVFVVARNSSYPRTACGLTGPITFKQQSTSRDFNFTLLAVGLVVWCIGTIVLVHFMIYFNFREKVQKEKELALQGKDSLGPSPTYLRTLQLEGQKFIKSLTLSDKIYIGVCSLIALAMGLPTDLVGGDYRDIVAGDFATSTIASVALNSKMNLVHFFIIIINVSLSVVFVWTLRKRSFAVIVAEELEVLPTREFAVEITGIPRSVCNELMLLEHFTHVYGPAKMLSVHIPLVYGDEWKIQALKERKEKYETIFKHTNDRPLVFTQLWHIFSARYKVDAIDYYEDKIAQLLLKSKLAGPDESCGYAYVTFRDRDVVTTCLKNNNHSVRWSWYLRISSFMTNETASLAAKVNPHLNASFAEALNCKDWKVRPAPLPYEINWKNLENSIQKKKVLTVLTLVVEIIVLTSVLSITAGLAVVEVARDLYLTDIYYRLGGATFMESIAAVVVVILPEAVALIEEAVAPIVETLEDRAGHVHKSGWRKTVMWHTAFFELLSGLVISRMVYFLIGVAVLYEASAPLNSYHYLFNKTGMDMMKYVCIKTFTVYGIKYPVLCIFKLIAARWTGQFERPEFDYYDLYAQKIVVMFCVIVYGSVMPLILPLGVMYLGISFLYDRWTIVTLHKKDTLHDSKLFYFTIAPLATLLIISKLFFYWPILAAILIIFSIVVGIVMLETRRWQYQNQNLKGVHAIIKASDHTLAGHISSSSMTDPLLQNDSGSSKGKRKRIGWSSLTKATFHTKHVLMGVMKGMQEGVGEAAIAGDRTALTEEDVLRAAYVHPLNKS